MTQKEKEQICVKICAYICAKIYAETYEETETKKVLSNGYLLNGSMNIRTTQFMC